ncbi:MAG: hypothetical protein GQ569_04105 [Methylococcaceae bacterium]|nr:hypothetical protein [Methylococcaceae bacterium]
MNTFKRLFVSMKAQIDTVADEFENHEALAGAAIKDLETLGRKTRVHLHKVHTMVAQYQQQLNDLQQQEELWTQRALKARDQDEQKALQCVKRLRSVREQIKHTEKLYQQSQTQENKIQGDLNHIQNQLQNLKNKKELLTARQNRAHVQQTLVNQKASGDDVDDIFERWESSVVGNEYHYTETTAEDEFTADFEKDEDDVELKMLLDELKPTDVDLEK